MASKPSLAIFSGSENFGNVFSEELQLNIRFSEFVWPLSDVDGNTAVQWKGKIRVIMIQGAHDGTGFSGATQEDKLGDFISTVEIWARGATETLNIQASTVYTDSFGVTYTVKGFDWTWKRSFSDPSRIIYTLLLKQV